MTATKTSSKLTQILAQYEPTMALVEILPKLATLLPPGESLESDRWNVISWLTRPGNGKKFIIYFDSIKNVELRDCVKVFTLHKRLRGLVGTRAVRLYFDAVMLLDKVILRKGMKDVRSGDFYAVERLVKQSGSRSGVRYLLTLKDFADWLNWQLGLPLSYEVGISTSHIHGRKGSEAGRDQKLVTTSVIRDLISANTRPDLLEKDRFFLSIFVILVATGFRINELTTMPKHCLLQNNGITSLRFFPEKDGEMGTRYIASDMVPSVTAALNYITKITEPGRTAVALLRRSRPLDWSAILGDQEAANYFVAKFAHQWTSDPKHKMINPDGAWLEKEKRVVDVMALVKTTGSKSAAARSLGVTRCTLDGLMVAQANALAGKLPSRIIDRGKSSRHSWDTDTRVISFERFRSHCGIALKSAKAGYRHIIDEAQRVQLAGNVYPSPDIDEKYETLFTRTIRPVIIDKLGRARLLPEDALFITPRYGFSGQRSTKDDDYRLITDKAFARWFSGERRSHGTGNNEDSCFNRLGIVDPKTGKTARFTSHDIRHWLDTTYAEGHMDECIIALVFGRQPSSNHTYDQTSRKKRLENLRHAIREGNVLGHLSCNYKHLASYSREEAEKYLMAYTLMVNIMPHGVCTLNWGLTQCPHHLGCFTKNSEKEGPCEFFLLDKNDNSEMQEILRIAREVDVSVATIPESSPQYTHYQGIKENLALLLGERKPTSEGQDGPATT